MASAVNLDLSPQADGDGGSRSVAERGPAVHPRAPAHAPGTGRALNGTKRQSWVWDELKGAGPEHLDASYVAAFDRKSAFDPEPDLAVLKAHGLGASSTLLDYGAGTGVFAIAASRICRRVVAIDVSPAMLELLRRNVAGQHVGNVEVVAQGFLTYEHQGEPADFVYSKNALHHLPDFWKAIALERIAIAMKKGGVFRLRDLVYSFEPRQTARVIESWLSSAPANAAEGWTREELETHIREEFSPYSWVLEAFLVRAGFEIREANYSDTQVFASYTCIRV
jgi:SAM-dependent methyltransferase